MILHFIEGVAIGIVLTATYIKIKKHRKKVIEKNRIIGRDNREFACTMFKCTVLNTLHAKKFTIH